MRSSPLRLVPAVLWGATLSGCLSQMSAQPDSRSLDIRWEADFQDACREARSKDRPILLVLAAGDLRDRC